MSDGKRNQIIFMNGSEYLIKEMQIKHFSVNYFSFVVFRMQKFFICCEKGAHLNFKSKSFCEVSRQIFWGFYHCPTLPFCPARQPINFLRFSSQKPQEKLFRINSKSVENLIYDSFSSMLRVSERNFNDFIPSPAVAHRPLNFDFNSNITDFPSCLLSWKILYQ